MIPMTNTVPNGNNTVKWIVILAMAIILLVLLFFAKNILFASIVGGFGFLLVWKGDFISKRIRFLVIPIITAIVTYALLIGWIP